MKRMGLKPLEAGQLADTMKPLLRGYNAAALMTEQRLLGETLLMFGDSIKKDGLLEMPALLEVIERHGKRMYPGKRTVFPIRKNPDIPIHTWIGGVYQQVGTLLITAAQSGKYSEALLAAASVMLGPAN